MFIHLVLQSLFQHCDLNRFRRQLTLQVTLSTAWLNQTKYLNQYKKKNMLPIYWLEYLWMSTVCPRNACEWSHVEADDIPIFRPCIHFHGRLHHFHVAPRQDVKRVNRGPFKKDSCTFEHLICSKWRADKG